MTNSNEYTSPLIIDKINVNHKVIRCDDEWFLTFDTVVIVAGEHLNIGETTALSILSEVGWGLINGYKGELLTDPAAMNGHAGYGAPCGATNTQVWWLAPSALLEVQSGRLVEIFERVDLMHHDADQWLYITHVDAEGTATHGIDKDHHLRRYINGAPIGVVEQLDGGKFEYLPDGYRLNSVPMNWPTNWRRPNPVCDADFIGINWRTEVTESTGDIYTALGNHYAKCETSGDTKSRRWFFPDGSWLGHSQIIEWNEEYSYTRELGDN